ncbi:calcium-binding protein [Azospirillum argentinense]
MVELADEGTDTVNASVSWVLGANLENLTLTGSAALNGTGNALDNVLTGNGGSNLLDGGAGNDTLAGGNGNDTLDGGTGDDSLSGGAGNDVYIVDSAGDVVTELASQGTDEVRTSLVAYALGVNVEVLTYTGSGPFSGAGNALDNRLAGADGDDSLSGGAGTDTLVGGLGADTLDGGSGNDTLRGDGGANRLDGGAGDDVLEGRGGNDTLVGGAGNDTAAFAGNARDYLAAKTGSTWTIQALTGAEGIDTLQPPGRVEHGRSDWAELCGGRPAFRRAGPAARRGVSDQRRLEGLQQRLPAGPVSHRPVRRRLHRLLVRALSRWAGRRHPNFRGFCNQLWPLHGHGWQRHSVRLQRKRYSDRRRGRRFLPLPHSIRWI